MVQQAIKHSTRKAINMKRVKSAIIILAAVVSLVSCEKNTFKQREVTYPEGKALVKVGLFTAYNVNSPMRVAFNGEYISNELLYAIPFPGGGFNTGGLSNSDYLVANPGTTKVELFMMNVGLPKPATRVMEANVDMEANKRYTLFLTDTASKTSAWLVNVDGPTPDTGTAAAIFANGIPNLASVDFYKGATETTAALIAGNVKYKEASQYIKVTAGTDSIFVRKAGEAISVRPFVRRPFTFSNQRLYTVLTRGYDGATGNRITHLSAIVNQ
jgi:hypothetical protein